MIAFLKTPNGQWVEIGRTEVIKDSLNPEFATGLALEFHFETRQLLRFVVVDVDDARGSLEKQDFVGFADATLGEIVSKCKVKPFERNVIFAPPTDMPFKFVQRVRKSRQCSMRIFVEELKDSNMVVKMKCSAISLDKKNFFGKSDPFVVLGKHTGTDNGGFVTVHQTEFIKNTLSPSWIPFQIPLALLNNGEMTRLIQISVFDWDRRGGHILIGVAETTLDRIITNGEKSLDLINTKKKLKGSKYINSGVLLIQSCTVERVYGFLDYISAGTEISLDVGIDFTASNGDPRRSNSLHYMRDQGWNYYQEAIIGVGQILESYDTDRKFPVYGFGARLPTGETSHCWPLNGNYQQPEVSGVDGILAAYSMAMSNIILHGPTNFSPLIKRSAQDARKSMEADTRARLGVCSKYHILLIITDGIITDMDLTVKELVLSSDLPLSVVIIGVGNADFEAMQVLDADDEPLRFGSKVMMRDIVQFVPFKYVVFLFSFPLFPSHSFSVLTLDCSFCGKI